MEAKQFNQLADQARKISETLNRDLHGQIKDLSRQADEILQGQNPTVSEFEFEIGRHKLKAEVKKNGNILLLSQSNGVVEEIKKRLRDDRHI